MAVNSRPPLKIIVSGPLKGSYSLAVINRAFATALAASGQQVILHSSEDRQDLESDRSFLELGDLASTLISDLSAASDADLLTANNWPIVAAPTGVPAVMHCFAWEESIISFRLASMLSGYKLIGTTASFVTRAFRNSGVTCPLVTMGNGTDHISQSSAQTPLRMANSELPFTFLHSSSCFPRKGADVLIDAYFAEFTSADNVRLIIKTFSNPHNTELLGVIEKHRAKSIAPPIVEVRISDLESDDYLALYTEADCLVAPSFGEGFLLPAAEAMLQNCPVITTGWGGQTDFCTNDTAWLIRYSIESSNSHIATPGAQWARPDKTHLQYLMRFMTTATLEDRLKKIKAGRRILAEQFGWDHVVQKFINAVFDSDVLASTSDSRVNHCGHLKHAVVSTFGQRCGVATFSHDLIGAASSRYEICGIVTEDVAAVDITWDDTKSLQPIYREWRRDNSYVQSIVARLNKLDCEHVLIEHHPGIFAWAMLAELVAALKSQFKVTIELHSVLDGFDDLKRNAEALQKANRIIVHNPDEYALACQVFRNETLSLIPHGVAKPPENLPQRSKFNGIRVISFGFMAPHKGFHRVIEACAILRAAGIDVRYTLQSAVDPERADAVTYAKYCVEVACSLAVEDFIDFQFDFCEIDYVVKKAAECDVAVLAYDDVPEGASGASRVLLRSGIPLVVPDLPVFQDLKGACIFSRVNSPYYFAREIAYVTSSIAIWNGQVARQYDFLASTQWSRIADMIFGAANDY